ncbi:asparagine--tRNA ligase [Spiroplasma endosymbiont of 'Nebria riversi']|uniref:asparagine--tRNA ligase n=1 Tax=Spiroplasma endosymbiont of 'Nebria riversi' TaxID=2792084 RepID=UPI001C0450C3|nr:asparagine--tRNA ligase [Spiroplasma endosymbiont of 'Nebria riversi']
MLIKKLYETYKAIVGQEITLKGWVRTNRDSGKVGFISLNDGSYLDSVQVVYNQEIKTFNEIKSLRTGSSIAVTGVLVLPDKGKELFEIKATNIKIYNNAVEQYPLQKKEHSNEYLREIAHLRARTNKFWAIFKIRSSVSYAIHCFFQRNDFLYLHSPIITSNDAEGAGEAFIVTTREDNNYQQDFFSKKANLTVSGQLNAEAYTQAFNRVYTFGPTFRAEKSHTSRHVAEFWMVEPEVAYSSLEENIKLGEELIKYIINYILEKNKKELKFLNDNVDNNLLDKLKTIVTVKFVVMTYDDAIMELIKVKDRFENKDIHWGMDLQTEHERYLCEQLTNKPTFITNYPQVIKAFYMKTNEDNKTVQAMDLLVPGIGELIGGSQREDNYEKLLAKMQMANLDIKDFQWYLNLRQYGYAPSGGFGLGLERLIMYLTGMTNIRDVLPFPRVPNSLEF